jgi:hypothetical protein
VPRRRTPSELADAIVHELEQPHVPPAVTLPSWDECADAVAALYDTVDGRTS